MAHYTAWLAVMQDCCYGEFCEVSVTVDTLCGVEMGSDGEETPVYESTTDTVLEEATDVSCGPEGDLQEAVSEAERILVAKGWEVVGEWISCSEGFYVTVEKTRP